MCCSMYDVMVIKGNVLAFSKTVESVVKMIVSVIDVAGVASVADSVAVCSSSNNWA